MTRRLSVGSRRAPLVASLGCALATALLARSARGESPSLDFAIGSGALIQAPHAPAGRVASRESSGAFLGVDGDWSVALPSRTESSSGGLGFGARVGYAWRSGLSIQGRYDYLGVHPTLGDPSTTHRDRRRGARLAHPRAHRASSSHHVRIRRDRRVRRSVSTNQRTEERGAAVKSVFVACKIVSAMIVAGSCCACSYAHVGSGEVGIVRTPSGVNPEVLKTGDWGIGFWDQATLYNARSQEQGEQLDVLASNGLKIVLDASIRYHIVPEEAVALDRELGVHYYGILIGPTLRSQARRVVGRYQPEEIYSTQREAIERQIREGVETAIKGRHVVLEAVLIRNVRLPDEIQTAITHKLEAEQQALQMKFVIARAQAEAEKRLVEEKAEAERQAIAAQGKANALRIDAQAAADAKRMEGQATADYQRALAAGLNEPMLRFYQIDAMKRLGLSPNSKLIFLGGTGQAPKTLLDLRDASKASVP
jgi:regulator of protease activity HflC (stomatin/prohibitin superfamily)